MTLINNLLDKLPDASRSGAGWKARCPAHDDRNPSLSIHEAENGNVLLKCHAGCTTPAVVRAIGLKMADLMAGDSLPPPRNRGDQPLVAAQQRTKPDRSHASLDAAIAAIKGRHDAHFRVWTYHDANGESVGAVIRFDEPSGKTYRPACLRDGKWYETAMPELRPLYALPGLTAADCVVVTEGEKAADAALRYEPFPVDVLPEPLRQFVIEAAVSIGCDPCYIAMPLLAACAAAIGNTHRLEVKKRQR